MKKSKDSALFALEYMLSGLCPGETVTFQAIIEKIDPQYRDKQTVSTAIMLAQKYGVEIKGE